MKKEIIVHEYYKTKEDLLKLLDKAPILDDFSEEKGVTEKKQIEEELLNNKNFLGVEELIKEIQMEDELKPLFLLLAEFDIADEEFCNAIQNSGINVQKGVFGADMQVSMVGDGPVTVVLDTDIWSKK